MQDDPSTLGVAEALAAFEAGTLSADALETACRARIAARDDVVRAWVHVAAGASTSSAAGPLAGIPFGIKDIIDTADMPTEHGSPIYAGHRPRRDAGCVALLKEAGAIALGKTVTAEFAFRQPGATRNPHNPAHTPGGSSSGSAAAVADFMVPFALGTQTLGSVIRPAAFCGIVGYKPSYGDVTRSGVFDVATSLDTVGLFARHAVDLALVRAAITGTRTAPLAPPVISALRFGVWSDAAFAAAGDDAQDVVETTAQRLERKGAKRVDLPIPETFAAAKALQQEIAFYELVRAIAFERTHRWDAISQTLRDGPIAAGLHVTPEAYLGAQSAFTLLRRQYADLAKDVDFVLAPPALGEAPPGLESTGDAACNMLWTGLHVPAVTLPVTRGRQGLPLGIQLVGRFHDDWRLLAVAEAVEATLTSAQ